MPKKTWKFAGISFDHMHMGDLLRQVAEHPNAGIVAVCDENPANADAMAMVRERLGLAEALQFSEVARCLEQTQPDVVMICSATGHHAEYVERVAPFGAHLLVEKPFAASLEDADRMIAAAHRHKRQLVINWPLAWYPPYLTTKRLLDEGAIGEVVEVHHYGGNRGPTLHKMDKIEVSEDEAIRHMNDSWWYQKARGGGSLNDYLGYGVTLGTWFHGGRAPLEVSCVTWARPGLEVDEHSITVCRYGSGLSKFETRWGTFTDPWIHQPQPRCGFVIVGRSGTIAAYDYDATVRVQTRDKPEGVDIPVDAPRPGFGGPIDHLIDVLERGVPVHGPLSLPICRVGQQIIDAAQRSAAAQGRAVPLAP